MEVLIENLITYVLVLLIVIIIISTYIFNKKKQSKIVEEKIEKAKDFGFHEPVSLHPVIDYDICIGSAACVSACPEKDILGIVHGKGKTINASHCVGHGACFHACPLQAITLYMGTDKRGVELPHVSPEYQTNIQGIYIAGELGGMGLIKNAVEQGKIAVENIKKNLIKSKNADFDLIIVGAGPAGISASLTAAKYNLKYLTLEQDTLGGTVFSFPRKKIIMTSPMELSLHGKVKLVETTKSELIELWRNVLEKNNIKINEQEKVTLISREKDYIEVNTTLDSYTASSVILAIGRRGSPRKLGVPGEGKEKVYYRLLEPELVSSKNILVVGGGDSAIESALLLAENRDRIITLSYRGNSFSRLKPKNLEKISSAIKEGKITAILNSNVKEIFDDSVGLILGTGEETVMSNELVYVFAGGELPNKFLENIGIKITKKFGEVVLKHS